MIVNNCTIHYSMNKYLWNNHDNLILHLVPVQMQMERIHNRMTYSRSNNCCLVFHSSTLGEVNILSSHLFFYLIHSDSSKPGPCELKCTQRVRGKLEKGHLSRLQCRLWFILFFTIAMNFRFSQIVFIHWYSVEHSGCLREPQTCQKVDFMCFLIVLFLRLTVTCHVGVMYWWMTSGATQWHAIMVSSIDCEFRQLKSSMFNQKHVSK